MDLVFGSSGVAQADQERVAAINAEIGLDRIIAGDRSRDSGSGGSEKGRDEKVTAVGENVGGKA